MAEAVTNRWPGADIQKPKDLFSPEDPQATWWAEFMPLSFLTDPKFVARWYGPDGSLFKEENFSGFWGNYQWAAVNLPIREGLARSLQGEWRVEILHRGHFIDRKRFFIGTPEVRKYAQPAPGQESGRLTLTFLPCYDDLTGGTIRMLQVSISQLTDSEGHLKQLQGKLQNDVSDAPLLVQIGWAQFIAGRMEEALDSFEKARALRPDSGFIRNLVGIAQANNKQYSESEQTFVSAAEAQPESPQIQFNLGETRLALGNYTDAKVAYEKAAALGLEDAQMAAERIALMDRALSSRTAIASGQMEATTQAVAADSPEAMLYTGALLYAGKRYEEAITALRGALGKDPKLADAHLLLGLIYLQREFPEQAEEEFASALKLDPKRVEGHVGLGATHLRLKEYDRAEASIRQALALSPKEAKAYELLGDLHVAQGNYDEAMAAYQTSIQHSPRNPGAHLGLATCYRTKKVYHQAVAEYQETLKVSPDSIEAHIGLGACYYADGDHDRAEEELRRALNLDPSRQDALLLYQDIQQGAKPKETTEVEL